MSRRKWSAIAAELFEDTCLSENRRAGKTTNSEVGKKGENKIVSDSCFLSDFLGRHQKYSDDL